MGISGLKSLLPGQPINAFDYLGCGRQTPSRRVAVDAANPLFACVARHPKHAFAGDYAPAMAEWRHLLEMNKARNLNALMVFDGERYDAKANETARRSVTREKALAKISAAVSQGSEPALAVYAAAVQITDEVLLLAIKLCREMNVDFVVAPREADPQLAAMRDANGASIPVISADTDMLALGVKEWIALDRAGWFTGAALLYRPEEWTVDPQFPLIGEIQRLGWAVLAYVGALLGDDFTMERCGVFGVGVPVAYTVLAGVGDRASLTAQTIVAALSREVAAGRVPRVRAQERAMLADGSMVAAIARAVGGFVLAPHWIHRFSIRNPLSTSVMSPNRRVDSMILVVSTIFGSEIEDG